MKSRIALTIFLLQTTLLSSTIHAASCADTALPDCDFVRTLLSEREGYGKDASGGAGGILRKVTNLNDKGAGSLRAALEASSPSWIIFNVSGTIRLTSPLRPRSNVTIDGRVNSLNKSGIVIENYGLKLMDVSNVILSDFTIRNVDPGASPSIQAEQDAIEVSSNYVCGPFDKLSTKNGSVNNSTGTFPCENTMKVGSNRLWFHRLAVSKFGDGLLDMTRGTTDVTISYSRFENHNKGLVMGFEYMPADKNMRVTIHHSVFDNVHQRSPRFTGGLLHMYNNIIKDWGDYGIASVDFGKTLIEKNYFIRNLSYRPDLGSKSAINYIANAGQEVGYLRGVGNIFRNQAQPFSFNDSAVVKNSLPQKLDEISDSWYSSLLSSAGPRVKPIPVQPLQTSFISAGSWSAVGGQVSSTSSAIDNELNRYVEEVNFLENSSNGYHYFHKYFSLPTAQNRLRLSYRIKRLDTSMRLEIYDHIKQGNYTVVRILPKSSVKFQVTKKGATTSSVNVSVVPSGADHLVTIDMIFTGSPKDFRAIFMKENASGTTTYTGQDVSFNVRMILQNIRLDNF